jgi:hypothetical protein
MKRTLNRLHAAGLVAVAGAACVVFPSISAFASWPMARHDAKRAGATTGTSNLTTPVPYWRTYLGGAISGTQLLTADTTGSGKLDFLLANNGLVRAVETTNTELWKSPLLGIQHFAGIADLDGDGTNDVVTYSNNQVIVLSVRTGAVEWTEPTGEMGTIGSVRVGDVTGDGKPDVLVTECGCCGVNSGNTGYFWSFGSGFTHASSAGSIPSSTFDCSTANSVTLLHASTSTSYQTLLAGSTQFALLDGSGNVLAETGTVGTRNAESVCTSANIDGSTGDEAICILNSADSPATMQRRITVLHYNYSAQPPTLDVVWSKVVAPDTGGDMHWIDPVQDLAGDGKFEVIVSTNDPTNGWQTHIYNAQTGADLVTPLSGEIVAGTAAMEATTSRVLLTSKNNTLKAWTFTRNPTASTTQRWTTANVSLLTYTDMSRYALQSLATAVVATDLNGDGLADAVTESPTSSTVTSLIGISGAGGQALQVAELALPSNVDLGGALVVPPMSTTKPQVAIARTDGLLNLLDGKLSLTSVGTPGSEVDVRFGGYYAPGGWTELYHSPRLVAFTGGTAQTIIVDDSRNALLSMNATAASLSSPPSVNWTLTHTYGPTIVAGLDGTNPGVACLAVTQPATNPPVYRVRVARSNGTLVWDRALTGVPLNDLAPGKFNSDAVPDLALQVGTINGVNLSTMAISGSDGTTLWSTTPVFPGGGGTQSSGVSVADWNADGTDDIHYQGAGTFVLNGADGGTLATGGTSNAYSLPMLYDTTGSGQYQVILNAGFWPVALYSHDLQTAQWTSTDNDHPYPYGAMAKCSGSSSTVVLVEGSLQNPARLKLTPMNGSSLGTFSTVVLAGGQLYKNESAATASGAFLGQLTAANVHSNLTGKNRPSAVVGSSDGWLYAINPCDGTLDFSVQIGSPVGEPVFGDTDGDGNDEILATAADGYLYDLKNQAITAPAYVWDTDPDQGITDHDVDSIVTTDKLSAAWAAVTGATAYQVEVVTTDGQLLSTPKWQSVGTLTSTSLTGLSLQDGTKYFFAVRAISTNGPSVDTMSNGVTVHFPGDGGAEGGAEGGTDAGIDGSVAMDSGSDGSGDGATDAEGGEGSVDAEAKVGSAGGGGCGCRLASPASGTGWLAVFAASTLAGAVRRRRSRR